MKKLKTELQIVVGCLLCVLTISAVVAASQKYENFNWQSPNGWEGAVFDVPTWFAKDMQYSGREVIRFHDGFYDEDSNGFWTYAFALLVEQTEVPTTEALIDETGRYFTGLVRGLGDNKKQNYPASKIMVSAKSDWLVSDSGERRSQLFELKSFDSFTTGKEITLNVKITTWLCSGRRRAIHYAISPHGVTHSLWNELDKEVDALRCW